MSTPSRCGSCDESTIERKTLESDSAKLLTFNKLIPSSKGIICASCHMFHCDKCITKFVKKANGSLKRFKNRHYFDILSEYIKTGFYEDTIVCHCCNIRSQFEMTEDPEFRKLTDTREMDSQARDLGGCLYFPQWDALFPTSFTTMSIHGLGGEMDGNLPDSYHCVLPNGTYASIKDSSPTCKPIFIRVPVKLPHLTTTSSSVFFCYVTILNPSTRPFSSEMFAGRNNPPSEWLKDAEYFDFSDVEPSFGKNSPNRISIIIGVHPKEVSSSAALLSMEFHDNDPSSLCKIPKALFEQLRSQIGLNLLERKRSGGSSGTCYPDKQLFDMLTLSGSIPRRANAAMWVEDKNSLEWHWFYIRPQDGKCCTGTYSQPVVGGKFRTSNNKRSKGAMITSKLFQVFPAMIDFVYIKPLSALILRNINASGYFKFSVVPVAVAVEINSMNIMSDYMSNLDIDLNNKARKREFCVQYSNEHCNYTLVEHPVGSHRDTFGKDENKISQPGLENKMCFVDKTRVGSGRGGSHEGYVFALLDWPDIRKVWVDPANRNLPHGMNQYGGDGARMNQDIRVAFWNANQHLQGQMDDPNDHGGAGRGSAGRGRGRVRRRRRRGRQSTQASRK